MTREQNHNDDIHLVKRCQKGDKHAMHLLYNRHHTYVYAVVRRLTRQLADAEDVVQETFVRAWRALPRFRAEATFRTWILRIAVNLCRNLHERRKETVALFETAAPQQKSDALAQKWLDRALGQLSEGYREVLVLHDVLEMKHGEIAQVLGLSIGTSKSQLHRARAKMRDILLADGSSEYATAAAAVNGR